MSLLCASLPWCNRRDAPPWRRIREEETKCESVRIVLRSCAHVVGDKRLCTNNHNHRQFAHTRRTRSQPVSASRRRNGCPPTAGVIQLEWRVERKVLLP